MKGKCSFERVFKKKVSIRYVVNRLFKLKLLFRLVNNNCRNKDLKAVKTLDLAKNL